MDVSRSDVVEALRNMSDVDRATIYAESIPQAEPIQLDDLKTMTPQQIVNAHKAGRLDHIAAEQATRRQATRTERGRRHIAAEGARAAHKMQTRVNRGL